MSTDHAVRGHTVRGLADALGGHRLLEPGLARAPHYRQQPTIILWQLGFPIVSVLLFVYVFGSAMDIGGGADYNSFAMPGMFAMTMAFGFMNTAYAMVIDKEKGVTDRFRSMPMARSAVVTGRGVGDVLGAAIDLAVLAVIAVVVGWRSEGGVMAHDSWRSCCCSGCGSR